MWNPAVFYQLYVMGMKEEKTDTHLVQGKIIHALLLEEAKFNDLFVISPSKLPVDSARTVIDRVYAHYFELSKNGDQRTKLEEFEGALLDVMKDINYHQSLKTDQQRLDKIITSETLSYWDFLATKGNKTLIDQQTYDFCKGAVELIKKNKDVMDLIGYGLDDFSTKDVVNELPVYVELADYKFGLKGIIDSLVVDHEKKTIFVNDIKTTSKDLKDFPESIEFYSYWMQAIIYVTMVTTIYKDLIDRGYTVKFNFVVIDRVFQTYAFPVSQSTLETWLSRLFEVLKKANWHYETNNYELPYDFANRLVVL